MPNSLPGVDVPGVLAALSQRSLGLGLVATGGGAAAIASLVAVPGASRVVVEGLVPYARPAVDALLGGPQESYCSSRAARRLAMVAWERCCRFGTEPRFAVGVGCVASLATTVPKRGDHRVIVALQSLDETSVATLLLHKGARTRGEEEVVAASLLLERIAAGPGQMQGDRLGRLLLPGEEVVVESQSAPSGWSDLLAGRGGAVKLSAAAPPGKVDVAVAALPAPPALEPPTDRRVIFPGSFDPLHDGHRRMARIAGEITGLPVEYEISMRNVDKPALDFIEIASRAGQFAGDTAWLTAAATFVEKLAIFPGARFVVGADTFLRLGSPRYYGDSATRAGAAVARIAGESGGLIVFGRVRDGVFTDPSGLEAPAALRSVSRFVSEEEFRDDVSSSRLRDEAATQED